MWVIDCDLPSRQELVGTSFDVYTPTRQFRIEDEISFRTYTLGQFNELIEDMDEIEVTAVYDFGYNIDQPILPGPETEDAVFVLKKRSY